MLKVLKTGLSRGFHLMLRSRTSEISQISDLSHRMPEGITTPVLAGSRCLDLGRGNRVLFASGNRNWRAPKTLIDDGASNNLIIVGRGSNRPSLIHFQGNNNLCVLGEEIFWPLDIAVRFASSDGLCVWGRGATSNGTSIVIEGDRRSVLIGDDCMFAAGTTVRTSDLHAIFELASGELLNPSSNVDIGAHVWIGQDALIGKGVKIGVGSIVGAKALVVKDVPPATLVGGVPAQPLRSNVGWSRERPATGRYPVHNN